MVGYNVLEQMNIVNDLRVFTLTLLFVKSFSLKLVLRWY